VGEVPSRIDLVILRAAGALRLINAFVQNPALANEVASRAAAGDDIDIEEPTNNPDGWAAYGEVFRDLEALLLDNPVKPSIVDRLRRRTVRRSLALRVPDDYSALDVQQDRLNAEQAPDLSDGQYRLADILAALEWQATVFDWFKGKGYGDKVMVDVSQSNSEEWSTLAQISLARGLFALVDPYTPIWIVQRAGQNAHLWPGFREQPIFTRHIDNQFNWLAPIALDPSWLIYYLANSGLGIESNLEATILAAVVHSVGPEALEVRPGPKGLRFTVPQPGEFFLLPDDVVQKYID
jgi:hypothetical protein